MDGKTIADEIEKLIEAKVAKQIKKADGNWTAMDEKLHGDFVSKCKRMLAGLFSQ